MRIRLVYQGELRANQRDPERGQSDKLAEHKQSVRKIFHQQLRHHWNTDWFLSSHKVYAQDYGADTTASDYYARWAPDPKEQVSLQKAIANSHSKFGYQFVPLVQKRWRLSCSLHILFMRHDPPGSLLSSGDLDNRVKTLIDTLRMPANEAELSGNKTPSEDESPFFCLLENDDLVSGLSVETDRLLVPPESNRDEHRRSCHIVITADIRPYDVTTFNLSFAS